MRKKTDIMSIKTLALIIIITINLNVSCTTDNSMSENSTNRLIVNEPSLGKTRNVSVATNENSEDETEVVLKKLSADFGVKSLKDKLLQPESFELRIWAELGYITVNCFIVTKTGGKWAAKLISAEVENGEFNRDMNGKVVLKKYDSLNPSSGWDDFETHLMDRKMDVPLPFVPDNKQLPPMTDEGTIDLQIKKGDKYDLVSYREFTKSEDGKKLIKFCEKVESEFGHKIGCGY